MPHWLPHSVPFTRVWALSLLLWFVTTTSAHAHLGGIRGAVTEDSTGRALTGATVRVLQNGRLVQTLVTDVRGLYATELTAGIYEVEAVSVGHVRGRKTVSVADVPVVVDFRLQRGGIDLEEVVITADREMGRGANTLSQVDIRLRPVNNSQDLLRMVPGLILAQHAGGGKAEQIFLRGFDIDHGTDIAISTDGLPVNMVSHAHGQGYADLHFVIPETVERVDFNKGPYYADIGNFGTAGYVQFRTRDVLDQNLAMVQMGSFNTWRAVVMARVLGHTPEAKNNAYIAAEYVFTDGYFDRSQNFNRLNLLGKYHLHIGAGQSLTIGVSTFTSRWDASGQIPQRAVDRGIIGRFGAIDTTEGGNTRRTNAYIRWQLLTADGAEWQQQVYYSRYTFQLFSNFTLYLNNPALGDGIRQAEGRDIWGYNGSYTKHYQLGRVGLRSRYGAQARWDRTDGSFLGHYYQRVDVDTVQFGDVNELNLALYTDQTLTLGKWTVNAALRYDWFRYQYADHLGALPNGAQRKGIVSPKLSLYYQPQENVQFFVKSGIGFHGNDTRGVIANAGLQILPAAYGLDAGINAKLWKKVLVSAAFWQLDLDQEFVYVGDEGVVEAGGRTRRLGMDVSLRWQALRWLYLDADFNYAHARARDEAEGNNYIPLAPVHTSIGGLTIRKGAFEGSLRYRYVGDRPANEANTVTAKGYYLMDAVVRYRIGNYLEVGAMVENLLDNRKWNEAQFDTESQLQGEAVPVSELHFTPGTPFSLRGFVAVRF